MSDCIYQQTSVYQKESKRFKLSLLCNSNKYLENNKQTAYFLNIYIKQVIKQGFVTVFVFLLKAHKTSLST